jgi:hypothetical protein
MYVFYCDIWCVCPLDLLSIICRESCAMVETLPWYKPVVLGDHSFTLLTLLNTGKECGVVELLQDITV